MRLGIVIPVFNEGGRLFSTVERLGAFVAEGGLAALSIERVDVVLVDDGSQPAVAIDAPPGGGLDLHLLRHYVNLGQGAALQTGISYASSVLACDLLVTMDSDGQHRPEDLPALLGELRHEGADIVFGNRFASGLPPGIPTSRLWILRAAAAFEVLLTGIRLRDAHNGFRAFTRAFALGLNLRQNRMAHATEFKQHVARSGARYREAPVSITYSADSLGKGQRSSGSLIILKDLLASYLFSR